MKTPKAPGGLSPAAAKLWRDVVTKYELRLDELRVLEMACRSYDLCARIAKDIPSTGPLTVPGSKGQPTAHPLLAELRAEVRTFAGLCRQLGLPDDEARDGLEGQIAGRALAGSRWGNR